MLKRALTGLGLGAVGAAIALAWAGTASGLAVEAQSYDRRLAARETPARDDIAIIEINESSVRALEPVFGRWPWPRLVHSLAINYLARARARAIVYDVQFTEADTQGRYQIGERIVAGPESDGELVAAVRRAGNVVLLADATFQGLSDESRTSSGDPTPALPGTTYAPGAGLLERPSVRLPFAALRDAAAAVGHNFLVKDAGGVSRAMYPFIASRGAAVPSLGMASVLLANQVPAAAVRLQTGRLQAGEATLPLRDDGQLLLKLHGPFTRPAGSPPFPVYSFLDVLLSEDRAQSGQAPPIPASAFAGKIVFIGTTAAGLADVHATAFGGSTPGVYLHATLADNTLSREFMRRGSKAGDAGLTIAAGVVTGAISILIPVWWALALVAGLASAAVFWATRLVGHGLWVPVVGPLAAAGVALVGGFAWQYFVEGREKRVVKRLFGRYVSPDIFRQLMANPAAARIGGERRDMSVLFSDIRGFTAASERATPEGVVAQLNEHFTEMVEVLFRHQGTLDKFVGDQVMGLFGAPVADPRHADHAVAAAIDMSAALDRLNARWAARGLPPLDIGIGINSGEMIAGNIGSESIMSYTVIGDAVNVGSRIESLNKDYGTRILIGQATKDRLTPGVRTRLVGSAAVKGRREPVVVHEVIVTPGEGGPA
jgi:adenylate cyclase